MRLEVLLLVRFAEICVAQSVTTGLASRRSTVCRSRGRRPSRVDCRRQPAADAIAMEFPAPAGCVAAFGAGHGSQPSLPRFGFARKEEVGPSERMRRAAASRGRRARSSGPAPQSQPVAPAPRLAALSRCLVAFGLGLRMPAAGPARLRLYSFSSGSCERGNNRDGDGARYTVACSGIRCLDECSRS